MKYLQAPNGKVWRYQDGRISGCVAGITRGSNTDMDDVYDALSEAVADSEIGLSDISIIWLGQEWVEFNAEPNWDTVDWVALESTDDSDFARIVDAITKQYGLTENEVMAIKEERNALTGFIREHEQAFNHETVIQVWGSPRKLCFTTFANGTVNMRVMIDSFQITPHTGLDSIFSVESLLKAAAR